VLLHGTEDVNVPVSIARWVATHVPSARLIEQPGAGHLFALEHPQLVFEWVRRPCPSIGGGDEHPGRNVKDEPTGASGHRVVCASRRGSTQSGRT
jgi:hypothetical protein